MMKLADVNVLIYAMREDSPFHTLARVWLGETLDGEEPFGWHPLLGASLIRIATNRRIFALFAQPSTIRECLGFIEAVTKAGCTVPIAEGERFWSTFTDLIERYAVEGARVSDMYWAALAMEHDATLCSADTGFGHISELRWEPLNT